MTKAKPLYIDIHALQTVPPNNMNRDDTGSPKTARFGGVVRHRVSSQAWKKAIRDEFPSLLDTDEIGQRTKEAVGLIAEYVAEMRSDLPVDEAQALAASALAATGVKVDKDKETGYLLFISRNQARNLAQLAIDARESGTDFGDKSIKARAKAICNIKENPRLNAIDIALFGRMVADAPDLNVDAAVQVAHAIGIGKAETEFDYFTALDDRQPEDETGAAMIETTEFLSSTLYRYATVDIRHLYENLGSVEVTQKAIRAFLQAFIISMPTGKQNSFANRTLPSAVIVQLRSTQPVSLANAFEAPVYRREGSSTIEQACERLVAREQSLDAAFGVSPAKCYVIPGDPDAAQLGELATEDAASLEQVLDGLGKDVADYLREALDEA